MAGTTRDALEIRCVLGDVPVTLVDTAGLRATDDLVEAEGVRRARMHAAQADLVVHVLETGQAMPDDSDRMLVVCNKIDHAPAMKGTLGVSALTGAGFPALRDVLAEAARRLTSGSAGVPLTRARHRAGVFAAATHLAGAEAAFWPELRGEELRLAMQALGG